jgi:hypothetical protein
MVDCVDPLLTLPARHFMWVNQLLTRQLFEVLGDDASSKGLACERSLRVAAATLSNAARREITSTMVVGAFGRDDELAFRRLVANIADENELEAAITVRPASFSVRFSRT